MWVIHYLFGHTSKEVIERNEKLFQTYLIVFGLLLAYSNDRNLQAVVMKSFMLFISFGIIYYILMIHLHSSLPRLFYNLLALIMGIAFSFALTQFHISFAFGKYPGDLFWFLTILVAVSLFV